jgi:membrane protease YdiL (CAAX protease family)
MIIGVVGFTYVIFVLLRIEKQVFKISTHLNWFSFFKTIALKFLVITVVTSLFVWFYDRESFFSVPLNKPMLWFGILFGYSFFSVYPQELIYRTFFFQRYQTLFKNTNSLLLINAIVFSLVHLFFRNTLVILLTFLGGLFFALTYNKTKSTLLVSIEHAIYGCWLFTVGMGGMLGFPS